ncbi:MAG: hypothetical protein ABI747_04090 [Candidatus Moraniibacteriota bacterium]
MSDPVPFSTLLIEAARLSVKRRAHFLFTILLGVIATLSYFVLRNVDVVLPEASEEVSILFSWVKEHQSTLFILSLTSLGFALVKAALRGPLFVILEETLLAFTEEKKSLAPLSSRLRRASLLGFFFETFSFLVSALLFGIVFLPTYFALLYNPSALPTIFQLSSLLFLVGAVLFYFLKEYSLLYGILGGVRPLIALELGYGLFRKNLTQSLLFGTLILGLSFIFTFTLDSAIITSAMFFKREGFTTPFLIFLVSGMSGVFVEALRLLFFHSIAATRSKKQRAEKVSAQESVSETIA